MGCGHLGAAGASSKQCECKPVPATWPERQWLICACILFHQHSIFWNRGLQHLSWSATSCLCQSLSEPDVDVSEASLENFSVFLLGVTAWLLISKTVLLLSKQKQGTIVSCKIMLMMSPFCTGGYWNIQTRYETPVSWLFFLSGKNSSWLLCSGLYLGVLWLKMFCNATRIQDSLDQCK